MEECRREALEPEEMKGKGGITASEGREIVTVTAATQRLMKTETGADKYIALQIRASPSRHRNQVPHPQGLLHE
jgi:hypothetical protein